MGKDVSFRLAVAEGGLESFDLVSFVAGSVKYLNVVFIGTKDTEDEAVFRRVNVVDNVFGLGDPIVFKQGDILNFVKHPIDNTITWDKSVIDKKLSDEDAAILGLTRITKPLSKKGKNASVTDDGNGDTESVSEEKKTDEPKIV